MNKFTPKYMKMASKYLEESLDNLKIIEKEKENKTNEVKKSKSFVSNLMAWVLKSK